MLIRLADTPALAWKNGGGVTREMLAWPSPQNWGVRLSVATIDRSGAFSRFDEVTRWFTLIEGAGLSLCVANKTYDLDADSDPLCFDGGLPCVASVEKGPLSALNIMVRPNWRAQVKRLRPNEPAFSAGKGWLAVFCVQAGRYRFGQDLVCRDAGELDWLEVASDVCVQVLSGQWVVARFWSSTSQG